MKLVHLISVSYDLNLSIDLIYLKKRKEKKKPLNNKKNKKKRTVSKVNKESAKHSRNVSRNLLEDKKKKFSLSERDE